LARVAIDETDRIKNEQVIYHAASDSARRCRTREAGDGP
jgi:hypothetical protein